MKLGGCIQVAGSLFKTWVIKMGRIFILGITFQQNCLVIYKVQVM